MQITIIPQVGLPGAAETAISVAGDIITVDGTAYDLSTVPEGGEATPSGDDHPFVGVITRIGGEIRCAVLVALDDTAAPHQPADPAHWIVTVADGAVTIPAIRNEAPDAV